MIDSAPQSSQYKDENQALSPFHIQLAKAFVKEGIPERGRAVSTQAALEVRGIHVSVQSIHGWINGRSKPEIDKLPFLAEYLNTTCDFLLGLEAANKTLISSEDRDAFQLRIIRKVQAEKLDAHSLKAIEALLDHFLLESESRTK